MVFYLLKLVTIFLSLQNSVHASTSDPYICSWLYDRVERMDSKVTINQTKRELWLERQPRSLKAFLDFASTNIKIYTRNEFFAALDQSVKEFRSTLKKNDDVVFVFDAEENHYKSGQWVLGYIRNSYEDLRSFPVLPAQPSSLKNYLKKSTRIIYVDDASFSGKNASGVIRRVKNFFPDITSFEVLIPFTTSTARSTIKEIHATRFYTNTILNTLKEKADKVGLKIPSIFESASNLSLDFIDHKLPDEWSFPSFLTEGRVFADNGSEKSVGERIKFIENATPPYRQIPKH